MLLLLLRSGDEDANSAFNGVHLCALVSSFTMPLDAKLLAPDLQPKHDSFWIAANSHKANHSGREQSRLPNNLHWRH
jgi:hypothetical protein